ncbi:hypothetical protein DV738_g3000, partial [Chaetothyriales sp. CBS 135597]
MADRARRVRRHVSDDISDSSDASGAEIDHDRGRTDAIRRPGRDRHIAVKKSGLGVNAITGSKSLKLKITPSKLREVVRANEADSLRDTLGGGQVLDGPRKRLDDDRVNSQQDVSDEDEDDDDAEGEPDGDDDVEMQDASPLPRPVKVTLKPPTKVSTPSKPPKNSKPSKSSRKSSLGELDDAPGEEERSDEDDDASRSSSPMSGTGTPDPAKMTKRQRGQESEHLISLDMGPQQRKFFTDAEKAMKKDEHARKRKELTKRKIQEEKAAALNRLLKPQAGKSRGAAPKPETLANLERTHEAAMAEEEEPMEKPSRLYTRWVNNAKGVCLAVPEEWEAKYVGEVLYAPFYHGPPLPPSNGRPVQELD